MNRFLTNKADMFITRSVKPGHINFIFRYNHFQLLDFPEKYNINKNFLSKAYNHVQKIAHTKSVSSNLKDRKEYKIFSDYLYEAYITLNNDYERAAYLLSIKGVSISEEELTIIPEDIKELQSKMEELGYNLSDLKEEIGGYIEETKKCIDYRVEKKDLLTAKKLTIQLYHYLDLDRKIFNIINDS
jgi:hypothetical protein